MPVTIEWDNIERTRMLIAFEGRWTWDEVRVMADKGRRMLDQVEHKVDYIVYRHHANWLPAGYLTQVRDIRGQPHRNDGQLVVVTTHALIAELLHLFNMLTDCLQMPFRFARSLDEARALLEQRSMRIAGE